MGAKNHGELFVIYYEGVKKSLETFPHIPLYILRWGLKITGDFRRYSDSLIYIGNNTSAEYPPRIS